MRLTRTTEYALRALAHMALDEDRSHTSSLLHRELDIPIKYLRQVLTRLANADLLLGTRGRRGGYLLARPARKIFLAEIVDAIQGLEEHAQCFLGFSECPLDSKCGMHDTWVGTHERMNKALAKTPLSALLGKPRPSPKSRRRR